MKIELQCQRCNRMYRQPNCSPKHQICGSCRLHLEDRQFDTVRNPLSIRLTRRLWTPFETSDREGAAYLKAEWDSSQSSCTNLLTGTQT